MGRRDFGGRIAADTPGVLAEIVLARGGLRMPPGHMRYVEDFASGQVLAKWYAAHSAVRRLWAISESQRMRVIVALEPTNDGDDIFPAWLANAGEWAHELQLRLGGPVQVEVLDEPLRGAFAAGVDAVLVAELFWRDPTVPPATPPDDSYGC